MPPAASPQLSIISPPPTLALSTLSTFVKLKLFSHIFNLTSSPPYYDRNIAISAQTKVAKHEHQYREFATWAQHVATRPAVSQTTRQTEQHSSS